MAELFQAICGANRAMDADLVGCGKPILNQRELYRCTDCSIPFHRDCAIKHFATDDEEHSQAAYAEQIRRWDEKTRAAGHTEYESWQTPADAPRLDKSSGNGIRLDKSSAHARGVALPREPKENDRG